MKPYTTLLYLLLGLLILEGPFTEGRTAQSADLQVRAIRGNAEQGQANAQFILGLMYAEGRGLPKDEAEAVRWYRKAADQGDADARHNLSLLRGLADSGTKSQTSGFPLGPFELAIIGGPLLIIFACWIIVKRKRMNKSISIPSGPEWLQPWTVRPWIRYWARMFDILLFALLAGIPVAWLFQDFLDPQHDQFIGIFLVFAWVFVEAGLLSVFGTTPGKALFKIRLIKTSEREFRYADGISRSIKVWWRGLGIGFPIITIITMVIAYQNLNKFGRTSWDIDEGIIVEHGEIGPIRTLFSIVFFGAFLLLIFAGLAA